MDRERVGSFNDIVNVGPMRSTSNRIISRIATSNEEAVAAAETRSNNTAITQDILSSLNGHERETNREGLDRIGGVDGFAHQLGVNYELGLTAKQVLAMRAKFGPNIFPATQFSSYFELLLGALGDTTLLILLAAAAVSFGIGYYQDPESGWIDGAAIFAAVFIVSNLSAGNDYSKELQFQALEKASEGDQRVSVLREGAIERINPVDIVVGDIIVLQAGDAIPADAIVCDNNVVKCNESALTGEPDDLKKSKRGDSLLKSSCLITEGEECRAIVCGVGSNSVWGRIKSTLVSEAVNTPLQDKLGIMTQNIGYIGMGFALATFIALVANIWAIHGGENVLAGVINAFILAVTIIVVAIPEGLPLSVTIALAYSTKKMYEEQNFIRVLAACETMGNATNICSDKTGTLTENRMTVVEGWFADVQYSQDQFAANKMNDSVRNMLAENVCVNRVAYLVFKDDAGKPLDRPNIIGNKTEGALMLMARAWGFDEEVLRHGLFVSGRDKVFAFNSDKKRSTAIIQRPDGSVRLFCKGASEWVLKDCVSFTDSQGKPQPLTAAKRTEIENHINAMANRALRTLCITHKDYASVSALPAEWESSPPDSSDLCVNCVVGIIDPLRPDVKEAVATAQRAGVTVRMVTGDNLATACAIARQCGILKPEGGVIEGPTLRKLTPAELDNLLPNLQVIARSSPEDKYTLVTRLNGHDIPYDQAAWEERFKDKGFTWEADRDKLLPGYREEWEKTRPDGGQVVGVTGDGTNDAPALKAADVGLSMGITGTKVAQGASDIVILDDKFSSIIKAILWGRSVYDNIRKFLQFQLTVNCVALILVFVGAVCGFGEPLTAVQMLWVNLVMDTMGALALATEPPNKELLERKPYKRSASLVSRPMMRNILAQSCFQLTLLFVLLFKGAELFGVHYNGTACEKYHAKSTTTYWDIASKATATSSTGTIQCSSFKTLCSTLDTDCLLATRTGQASDLSTHTYTFDSLAGFKSECLTCEVEDYEHGTIIFNAFIWCQIFNEYNARFIFDEVNMFKGLEKNYVFFLVSLFTIGAQIFLVEIGGEWVKTTPLTLNQWLITIALGAIALPVGVLMRFIPVKEDPNSFFDNSVVVLSEKLDA